MQSVADLAKAVGQLPAPVRRVFEVRRPACDLVGCADAGACGIGSVAVHSPTFAAHDPQVRVETGICRPPPTLAQKYGEGRLRENSPPTLCTKFIRQVATNGV